MYDLVLSFLTAFLLSYFAIPSIIKIAKDKNLCDTPGDRTSHTDVTPNLGGIAIFAGVIFAIVMWSPFDVFTDLQYIIGALLIIFLIGAKDDIMPMKPRHKLIGELLAVGILVFKADIRLTSLYGIFGIGELNFYVSVVLSIFTIIVIINAFNLIDGINGLSGSIGVLVSSVLGTWFYLVGHLEIAIVAFALCGALIAFLKYNYTPARIFMGDTGSLLLGIISAILIIKFIEIHNTLGDSVYAFKSAPAMAIGLLILPLYDTIRVFTIRILNGKSPFYPDRLHIHHMLLDYGMTHMQATGVLVLANIGFIAFAVMFQGVGNLNLLLLILAVASLLSFVVHRNLKNKRSQKLA